MKNILLTVAAVLVALWVVGMVAKVAAGLISLLLVAAVLLVIGSFVTGRRAI